MNLNEMWNFRLARPGEVIENFPPAIANPEFGHDQHDWPQLGAQGNAAGQGVVAGGVPAAAGILPAFEGPHPQPQQEGNVAAAQQAGGDVPQGDQDPQNVNMNPALVENAQVEDDLVAEDAAAGPHPQPQQLKANASASETMP